MSHLRDKYTKIKSQLKKEHSDEKNAHNITGGGAYKKPDRLIDKTECFQRLADAISLSVKGLQPLPGEEGYASTSSGMPAPVADESELSRKSPDLFGFPEDGDYLSYSTVVVLNEADIVLDEDVLNADAIAVSTPVQISTTDPVPITTPESDASAAPESSSTTADLVTRKRKAPEALDEKPPLQLINPMAIRRPLPKVLKVKSGKNAPAPLKAQATPNASHQAHQDEAHEWRRKLFEAEYGLLLEKAETEKKIQHTESVKQLHMQEIHGLKMALLRKKMCVNDDNNRSSNSSFDMTAVDNCDYPNSQNSQNGTIL